MEPEKILDAKRVRKTTVSVLSATSKDPKVIKRVETAWKKAMRSFTRSVALIDPSLKVEEV